MLPLKNKWIVVTRPKHQAGNLKLRLEAAGANVLLFPLQEIKRLDDQTELQKKLLNIPRYDLAIFISPNAVEYSFENVDVNLFRSLKIAAIGHKTKSLLEAKGMTVDYCPDGVSNSETFLLMPDMLEFANEKKVVILRGNGGRDVIRDTLLQSSNTVEYIEVYERSFPHKDLNLLAEHYYRNELDIILITSGKALESLFNYIYENSWLSEVSLLLGSQRIKELAFGLEEHYGELFYSEDPTDEAMFLQLLEWAKMGNY